MQPKLGILAGGGTLPARLIEHCRTTGRPYFVVAFSGHCDAETVRDAPHAWFRLGAAGSIINALRTAAVRDLVMVGWIARPRLRDLRPDLRGLRILARIWRCFLGGDDALLRAVAKVLEGEGFRVCGIHDVMEGLLAPAGAFGRISPDPAGHRDVTEGVKAARDLGARDLGQAVLVRNGSVIAHEGPEGTDAMLRQSVGLLAGGGGVLVKMRKPQQDMRIDLPSIGPDTVMLAAKLGLSGVAVEAGNALVVDFPEVVRAADEAGIFVVGVDARQS